MLGTLPENKEELKTKISSYQPNQAVSELTFKVKQDFQVGYDINHRTFREFNDMDLISRINAEQALWNVYVEPKSEDPQDYWRHNGKRSDTRNKIITIAAHLTLHLLYPNIFAQNSDNESDKTTAEVMKDLIEWHIDNSDYELSYLFGILAALTNPVAYLQVEFIEVLQNIKKKNENGEITITQAVDEVFSGLQIYNVPADEVVISNPYQFSIQKQKAIGRCKLVSYDELELTYGKHKNWNFVKPNVKAVYNAGDGLFYDIDDETLQGLCEKFTYYNRLEDTEVCFINGLYFGDENTKANRIKHRDTQDRPKYNIVKYGYEPIDAKRFFFYKSAAAKLANDQNLIDKMWQMIVDGTFLSIFKPIATTGDDLVDKSILLPGAVASFSKDTTITPIDIRSDLMGGYNAVNALEQGMSESTQDTVRQGVVSEEKRTAYEIKRTEQNALIQLGMFGKMIIQMTKDLGDLMVDLILTNQTVGELDEIVGEETALKYKTFLMKEKVENGKKVSKQIKFSDEMIGRTYTEEQEKEKKYELMDKEGGIDSDKRIYMVNPQAFRNYKFKIVVSADMLLPKDEQVEKDLIKEAYQIMRGDPNFNAPEIAKEFAKVFFPDNAEKMVASQESQMAMAGQQQQNPMAQKPMGLGNKMSGILPQ
jgi:hypothetical protein